MLSLVAEALVNSLWQGLLLAASAWILTRLLWRASAATRHTVWLVTLAAMVLLPFGYVVRHLAATPLAAASMPGSAAMDTLPVMAAPLPEPVARIPGPIRVPFGTVAVCLVLLWALAAGVLLVRLAAAYRRLLDLKRGARRLDGEYREWWSRWRRLTPTRRGSGVGTSDKIGLPVAVGMGRPVILFPERLLPRLAEHEARHIWLHELAHLERLDDWAQLGQRLAQALLFYHPAAGWVRRQIEIERELACDEWVVETTGAARSYAACLTKLAEYATHRGSASALAIGEDKKQIFRRVRMLINREKCQTKRWSRVSGWAALLAVVGLVAAVAMLEPLVVMADAQEASEPVAVEPAPPEPPAPPAPVVEPAPVAAPAPAVEPPPPPAAGSRPHVSQGAPAPEPAPAPAAVPVPAPAPQPPPPPAFRMQMEQLRSRMAEVQAELWASARELERVAGEEYRQEMMRVRQQLREAEQRMRQADHHMREMEQRLTRAAEQTQEAMKRIQHRAQELQQRPGLTQEKQRQLKDTMKRLKEEGLVRREMLKERQEEMERSLRERAEQLEELERRAQEKLRERQAEQEVREPEAPANPI